MLNNKYVLSDEKGWIIEDLKQYHIRTGQYPQKKKITLDDIIAASKEFQNQPLPKCSYTMDDFKQVIDRLNKCSQ